jgi:hypothetical protein
MGNPFLFADRFSGAVVAPHHRRLLAVFTARKLTVLKGKMPATAN